MVLTIQSRRWRHATRAGNIAQRGGNVLLGNAFFFHDHLQISRAVRLVAQEFGGIIGDGCPCP
jgi:hypothetical protein